MPFHLELGSDGHSFKGKAIVVNSITGRHLSHAPLPMEKAKAQKRVVEQAVAEHGEHVTASGKPDRRRKKVKAPAPPEAVPTPKMDSKGTPLPPAEAKRLLAQLAERKRASRIAKMKHVEPKVSMMKEEVAHGGDTSILPIKAKAKARVPGQATDTFLLKHMMEKHSAMLPVMFGMRMKIPAKDFDPKIRERIEHDFRPARYARVKVHISKYLGVDFSTTGFSVFALQKAMPTEEQMEESRHEAMDKEYKPKPKVEVVAEKPRSHPFGTGNYEGRLKPSVPGAPKIMISDDKADAKEYTPQQLRAWGADEHYVTSKEQMNRVLSAMVKSGEISADQEKKAKEKVTDFSVNYSIYKAPKMLIFTKKVKE